MGNNNHEQNDNLWPLLAGLLDISWKLFSLSQFGNVLLLNLALSYEQQDPEPEYEGIE